MPTIHMNGLCYIHTPASLFQDIIAFPQYTQDPGSPFGSVHNGDTVHYAFSLNIKFVIKLVAGFITILVIV